MTYLRQILPTAERTSDVQSCNNYVFMRSLKAYEILPLKLSGQVLEIGSGSGYGLPYISQSADMVISTDKVKRVSDEMLFELGNVLFVKHTLPMMQCFPSGQFDHVVCYQFIEHIDEDQLLLKEVKRVLKPGGRLYISTPNSEMTLSRNPWHIREYTHTEFGELLEGAGLCVDRAMGVYGNEIVMDYYEQNRANLEKLRKYDILNIEQRSNSALWRGIYDGMNHLNRLALKFRKDSVNEMITVDDFSLKPVCAKALDLFYECRK